MPLNQMSMPPPEAVLSITACVHAQQELYRWPSVAAAGRKALHLRYKLLPYLYTAFHTAHETGDPVARPLFYHWPQDRDAHSADGQFLLGDSILVTPVLQQVMLSHRHTSSCVGYDFGSDVIRTNSTATKSASLRSANSWCA